MLPDDRKVAEEKLSAIESYVAYPDWIVNDGDLTAAYEGVRFLFLLYLCYKLFSLNYLVCHHIYSKLNMFCLKN